MKGCIGIRREDKNRWERRTPLTPEHVRQFASEHSFDIVVQPSDIRAFSEAEYENAGARTNEDLSPCPIIFAIKEIPIDLLKPNKTYVFFAHVIKGQEHNMPLLKKMMELKCTLIDYERIVNEKGFRLIFFGNWAGVAGMTDTLWAFGQRLEHEGIPNPFTDIEQTYRYGGLEALEGAVKKAGDKIRKNGLPRDMFPLIIGLAGYGNVSRGCQRILDLLPIEEIPPEKLSSLLEKGEFSDRTVYKVVFKEEHMVEPVDPKHEFQLQDYYDHPEKYRGVFHEHVPYLTILMNCIYWEKRYPRLVTKGLARELFQGKKPPRLKVIGDISCDLEGAIEFTVKATDIDNPIFVYDPVGGKVTDGHEGRGIVVMAVDNLPCELPRESSRDFGDTLIEFVPQIAEADFTGSFEDVDLPPPIRKAVILFRGELTPDYRYLERFL